MKMANKIVFLLLNCLAIVFFSEATVLKNSQFSPNVNQQEDFDGGVEIHGTRTKRYSALGRVPLAYINANKGHARNPMDDNVMNQREQRYSPSRSSFREFRPRPESSQAREDADSIVESEGTWEDGFERPVFNGPDSYLPYAMARRNTKRYPGTMINYDGDEAQLSDQDLETLLLLLDGYALNADTKEGIRNPESYMSSDDFARVSRGGKHYGGFQKSIGKRDGGSSNYYSSQSLPIQTRSKRIGARSLFAMNSVNRIKKETDPHVSAQLLKIFGNKEEHEHLHDNLPKSPEKVTHDSSSTPPLLSGGHHKDAHSAPGLNPTENEIKKPAAKKDVDWSNYFGIDKKDGHVDEKKVKAIKSEAQTASSAPGNENAAQDHHDKPKKAGTQEQTIAAPLVYTTKDEKDKDTKESKAVRQREENETEDKSDRKWILKEFYKNLAMATNVKRKRESSPQQEDKLDQLEQQMESAGDKLIWDAVKYTGAHKGQEMTESELSQVKNHIIEKLSAAYSLEKLRQQLEEFRQELNGNTNDNYDTLN